MREATDRQVIIDMQHGDRAAMECFFHRYSPYLYAVCLRYLSDRELAKDVLQDAFVKIFTSIKTFKLDRHHDDADVKRSIKSWSARVTANQALNYLRDHSHLQYVAIDSLNCDDIPDSEIDAESLPSEILIGMIEDLPPNYRTVFNLFAIDGFSHRDIAKMLGISQTLSATQYHRAKSMLKIKIRQYIKSPSHKKC